MNSKMTILLVDDEPINLYALKSLLRKKYAIVTAPDGAQALTMLNSQEVDIIISDQLMPVMTGVSLLSAVMKEQPQVKRFILTAYSDNDELTQALNNNIVEHVFEKPFQKEELEKIISPQ